MIIQNEQKKSEAEDSTANEHELTRIRFHGRRTESALLD